MGQHLLTFSFKSSGMGVLYPAGDGNGEGCCMLPHSSDSGGIGEGSGGIESVLNCSLLS